MTTIYLRFLLLLFVLLFAEGAIIESSYVDYVAIKNRICVKPKRYHGYRLDTDNIPQLIRLYINLLYAR